MASIASTSQLCSAFNTLTVSNSRQTLKVPQSVGFRAVSLSVAPKSRGAVSFGRKNLQVQNARVGGVDVPNKKRAEIALTYIHGIGLTTSKAILRDTGVENKRIFEMSDEELGQLRSEVENYQIEGELRRFNAMAIRRLKEIQCYRGRRHIMRLPCRGQKTKTNARTLKGKKVAVAGKKKAPTR